MNRFILRSSVTISLLACLTVTTTDGLAVAAVSPLNAPSVRNRLKDSQILSEDPLVFVIPDLLSKQECQDYMEYVVELEESNDDRPMARSNPPQVSLDVSKLWPLPFLSLLAGVPPLLRGGDVVPPIAIALAITSCLVFAAVPVMRLVSDDSSSLRTSDAMALNLAEDISFVRPLVERVQRITLHDWSKWEAPVVTRYAPGAIFAKHGDATKGTEWNELGGQRVVTCIVYLNTLDGGGGETAFENFKVTPKQGQGLFFYPADAETLQADDRTIHESLPPVSSEKWIVQLFGRIGPRVPPPLGLPDEYYGK